MGEENNFNPTYVKGCQHHYCFMATASCMTLVDSSCRGKLRSHPGSSIKQGHRMSGKYDWLRDVRKSYIFKPAFPMK